jgi:hypothetical protein
MVAVLPDLINKQDGFELVRDRIAVLINDNQANQVALATAVAEPNPELWKLRVYVERSNPWELFTNAPEEEDPPDTSPIVNVWFQSGTFDEAKGNAIERQAQQGTFFVDCYGWGISEEGAGDTHTPGDEAAAKTAQRAVRLCRNILMAAENRYLQFPIVPAQGGRFVWDRWPQSITMFQPQLGEQSSHQVVGARLAMRYGFNEFAPEVVGDVLELLTVDIHRASDGMLIAEADYDYTAP